MPLLPPLFFGKLRSPISGRFLMVGLSPTRLALFIPNRRRSSLRDFLFYWVPFPTLKRGANMHCTYGAGWVAVTGTCGLLANHRLHLPIGNCRSLSSDIPRSCAAAGEIC